MSKEVKDSTDTDEAPRKASKSGTRMIVYRGRADVFEHGEHILRPGQPVEVPSDVAEDLLTYPNEKFEEAKE